MTGRLKDVAGFVPDAARVEPAQPFAAEQVELGRYTFLPWVRTGLAAAVSTAPATGTRAGITVTFQVQDDASGSEPVTKPLALLGPGDVLGLDPSQIVRRYPTDGSSSAEETYLVHVEFDRPELPWLFTPLPAAGDRLKPWLALVVVPAGRSSLEPGPGGMPRRLRTVLGHLQGLDDSWAWAHAQILGGDSVTDPSVADRLTEAYAPANLSRLVCPRPLMPDTAYTACVVPAFDAGVKVGLGLGGGTLDPAWTRTAGDEAREVLLPVYDAWHFCTAPAGDFKSLARQLEPIPAPWDVGRRVIDASNPRGDFVALAPTDPGRAQVVKCALTSPAPCPPGALDEGAGWDSATRDRLLARLNLADQQAAAPAAVAPTSATQLPRVGPRIYARFQRGQSRVEAGDVSDWFGQLNGAPTNRVVAGVALRVVQRDQEQLMQAAWAQVGDVVKANRALAAAQLARYAGQALLDKHLASLPLGRLGQITRLVQDKVRPPGSVLTVLGQAAQSAVAPAALTGAFRRATRIRGPLSRFLGKNGAALLDQSVASRGAFRDLRPTYREPDGVASLSETAIGTLDPAVVARVLGVAPRAALAELRTRAKSFGALSSMADRLRSPVSGWKLPKGPLDLRAIASARLKAAVDTALRDRAAPPPSQVEALGVILAGVVSTRQPRLEKARNLLKQIDAALPAGVELPPLRAVGGVPVGGGPAWRLPPVARSSTAGRQARGAPGAASPVKAAGPTPIRSSRRFDRLVSRSVGASLASIRPTTPLVAATALNQLVTGLGALDLPLTPDRKPLAVTGAQLRTALDPGATVTAYVKGRLHPLPAWLPSGWFDDGRVSPIMAAPEFTRPMYEALDATDRDWLVPGLGLLEQTDLVTVLETNPVFTEAFLVGLSDEMGRELLWREFPTDARGTYFKRFWSSERDELATPIHRFGLTPLGSHLAGSSAATGRVVLVVRGELVRRYPEALLLALRSAVTDPATPPRFSDPAVDPSTQAGILFHALLSPDVLLVGFDLTVAQVRAEPWCFVIAEHPTAPRFGLGTPVQAGQPWTGTAATLASALLQNPFRAAFRGASLIAPALPIP